MRLPAPRSRWIVAAVELRRRVLALEDRDARRRRAAAAPRRRFRLAASFTAPPFVALRRARARSRRVSAPAAFTSALDRLERLAVAVLRRTRRACSWKSSSRSRKPLRISRSIVRSAEAEALALQVAGVHELLELAAQRHREHRLAEVDRLAEQREAAAGDHAARGHEVREEAVDRARRGIDRAVGRPDLRPVAHPVDVAGRRRSRGARRSAPRCRRSRRPGGRRASARRRRSRGARSAARGRSVRAAAAGGRTS